MSISKAMSSKNGSVAAISSTVITGIAIFDLGDDYSKFIAGGVPMVVWGLVSVVEYFLAAKDWDSLSELRAKNAEKKRQQELDANIDVCNSALKNPHLDDSAKNEFSNKLAVYTKAKLAAVRSKKTK